MSVFNESLFNSDPNILIFDKVELKRNVNKYIDHVKFSDWFYHFNRIFISPANSFNVKYYLKVLYYSMP